MTASVLIPCALPWALLLAVAASPGCGEGGGSGAPSASAAESSTAAAAASTAGAPAAGMAAIPGGSTGVSVAEATYVGGAACAECHATESEFWTGSHHDLAMAEASEATVLGDFADAVFEHGGVVSRFFRRDGRFVVNTEGPDGEPTDYEIDYVFGVDPLQQYLVAFPGGRYQALSLSWDSRPAEAGGQHWFHLYPDETIPPGDPLHWTGPQANWNHMCADCHSTKLVKGYDPAADRFETTWTDIDVSCEACHGPGLAHMNWARAYEAERGDGEGPAADLGPDVDPHLTVRLNPARRWVFDEDAPIARREPPLTDANRAAIRAEVETCSRCHARRSRIAEQDVPGAPLLDAWRPALLETGLYHGDGQIEDEVYVFGSFLQSRMHHMGVTCSDCHHPHTTEVFGTSDGVCVRCHRPETFAVPEHHRHEVGTPGASCVECHMPATTYMVVDPRRDHSFRVPRPDLSEALGTPNACNGCHADRSAAWAATAIEEWHGPRVAGNPDRPAGHYGEALVAARRRAPDAARRLASVIDDIEQPALVRATALAESAAVLDADLVTAVERGLGSEDALVRFGAVSALDGLDGPGRMALAPPLLDDPVLLVRITAARILAPMPPEALTPDVAARLDAVLEEYRRALLVDADRASAHLNLGVLALERGDVTEAEREYRVALERDPSFAAAAVNLSDLLRETGRDDEGEAVLRAVLEHYADDGDVHQSLGLLLVRNGDMPGALASLGRAAELRPDVARYAYVYAIALNSAGRPDQAVAVLLGAVERHPNDAELLFALASIQRDMGARDEALRWARKLVEAAPGSHAAQQLLAELSGN